MLHESIWFREALRWLFGHRGTRALAHLMRRRMLVDAWVLMDDFDGDLKFHCHLNEHIGSLMYWRGSYSSAQLKVLDRLLGRSAVFVDVGANQGEFTLFAAKRLVEGRVLAFEPMPEMFERLQRNIAVNNLTNIDARQAALWSSQGRRSLFHSAAPFGDGSWNEGLATLFPTTDRPTPVEEIECLSLDDFVEREGIERVDVMKIDVEGAELEALRGCERILAASRPVLLLELDKRCAEAAGASLDQLLDLLEPDYAFFSILHDGRTRPLRRTALRDHQDIVCRPR